MVFHHVGARKVFCRVLPPRNLISRFRLGENVLDVFHVLDVVFDSFLLLYGVKNCETSKPDRNSLRFPIDSSMCQLKRAQQRSEVRHGVA